MKEEEECNEISESQDSFEGRISDGNCSGGGQLQGYLQSRVVMNGAKSK